MDSVFNREFYINLGVTIMLTIATVVSEFNFDLTVIMVVAWAFFAIIHTVKLYASLTEGFRIKDIQSSDIIGK